MKWKKDNKLPNTKSRAIHGANGGISGSFDQAISPPLSCSSNDGISINSLSPMNMIQNSNRSPEQRTLNGYDVCSHSTRQVADDYFGSYEMNSSSHHQPQRHGFSNSTVDRMLNGSPSFFYQRQSDFSSSKPNGGATVALPAKLDPLGKTFDRFTVIVFILIAGS